MVPDDSGALTQTASSDARATGDVVRRLAISPEEVEQRDEELALVTAHMRQLQERLAPLEEQLHQCRQALRRAILDEQRALDETSRAKTLLEDLQPGLREVEILRGTAAAAQAEAAKALQDLEALRQSLAMRVVRKYQMELDRIAPPSSSRRAAYLFAKSRLLPAKGL